MRYKRIVKIPMSRHAASGAVRLLIVLFSISLAVFGVADWPNSLGPDQGQVLAGYDVATDSHGNVLVVGCTDFDFYGRHDLYLSKYSKAGDLIWHLRIAENMVGRGIAVDQKDRIYVVGGTVADFKNERSERSDLVTIHLNEDGGVIWMKTRHQPNYKSYGALKVAALSDGCVVLAKTYNRKDYSTYELQTIRYGSKGGVRWAKELVTRTIPYDSDLIVDTGGNIICKTVHRLEFYNDDQRPRATLLKYSPAGDLIWSKTIIQDSHVSSSRWGSLFPISVDMHDRITIAHSTSASVIVDQFSPEGDLLWETTFLNPNYRDSVLRLAPDSEDGLVLVCEALDNYFVTSDDVSLHVVRLTNLGQVAWSSYPLPALADREYYKPIDVLCDSRPHFDSGGAIFIGLTRMTYDPLIYGFRTSFAMVKLKLSGSLDWYSESAILPQIDSEPLAMTLDHRNHALYMTGITNVYDAGWEEWQYTVKYDVGF
jgi:hypothetical protein